jgi:3-phosphoshikimate 1-carboxyvinyltransferase
MKGDVHIKPVKGLVGEIKVPGDKSVSHRAVIFGSMASGKSKVTNLLLSDDTKCTIEIMEALGADISIDEGNLFITGVGRDGFREPVNILDCKNSGTTMRLMMGVLAKEDFFSILVGDASLSKRPMRRVTGPLIKMGANILGRGGSDGVDASFAPIAIRGGSLTGIKYDMPVSSAQIKSALLLAGMRAAGKTQISDPGMSRDHTERMMRYFGLPVGYKDGYITVEHCDLFDGRDIDVVGDISSATFFIVGALITEKSDLLIINVGLNPGRRGAIDVLLKMGADIEILNEREVSGEPACDIRVKSSGLKGIEITGDLIPGMIDEVPAIAVAAAYADGETVITGAGELRVKESDRIMTTAENLRSMGVLVTELEDGLVIEPVGSNIAGGKRKLEGGKAKSFGDHRAAMAAAVFGLSSKSGVTVSDSDCVGVSFPGFFDLLNKVSV